MAEDQEQLIARIAAEVIEVLQQGGAPGGAAGGAEASAGSRGPVTVRPPAGVCTGDYSKFVELRQRRDGVGARRHPTSGGGAAGSSPSAVPANGRSAGGPGAAGDRGAPPSVPTLHGFVTARQLEDAGPVVRLAPDAKLTPLAQDYIKEKHVTIERASGNATASAAAARPAAGFLWWADGPCPAVDQVTRSRTDQLTAVDHRHQPEHLPAAVRAMAAAVKQERACGGILFVRSAAQAGCFANRCQSLRAVVGTCGEALEEGIALLAANVLIIEYPHVGPREMARMVERFTTAERPASAELDHSLKELRQCD